MTKPLKIITRNLYHFADGKKVDGPNPKMWGNCSGLSGDCSGLSGDCSDLRGDGSGLWGNCSGLWGNCSEIPQSARPANIRDFAE
jgi:hypothetical protein